MVVRRRALSGGVSAVFVLLFALLAVGAPATAVGPVVVYDSLPDPLPGNYSSLGFECCQTDELGDDIRLAGTARTLDVVTVGMSTWALQSEWPTWDEVSPGYWEHPITLNIYRTDTVAGVPTPGDLVATKTVVQPIPWRPEADPTCLPDTAWRASPTQCFNGLAFTIAFDFSADDVTLPGRIVVAVEFETNTSGNDPLGIVGPYNSLNVGLDAGPSVGIDVDPDAVMWDTGVAAWYSDGGAGGTDTLRHDANWTGSVPTLRVTATEGTSDTVVVKAANPDGWGFLDDNAAGGPLGTYVAGPGAPPLGTGSARLQVANSSQGHILGRLTAPGTRLDDITELTYSTYRASLDANDNLAISLAFNVDLDLLDANTGWQNRFVFEPYHADGGSVIEDTWQTWDALDGEWFHSNSSAPLCPMSSPCTWTELLAAYPNAGIHPNPALGAIVFKAGSGWATFDGSVDAFTLGIAGDSTTWDFEDTPQCEDDCYVDDSGNNANGGTSFADAKLTIQAGITAVSPGGTVHVGPGTYVEDVSLNKAGVTLSGDGIDSSIISGPIGGSDGATVRIAASGVTVEGFTITREGNNPTDWYNTSLNSAGVAIQGHAVDGVIRHNRITGNRTAIDVNDSDGNTIHANLIVDNRTGLIFRNKTDDTVLTQNVISDNTTVGVLFLAATTSGSPAQQAVGGEFSGNAIHGNWFGQVVDRQSGGAVPTPGTTNLKDFSRNWLGTTSPVVTTANSAELGYDATQVPPWAGGTDTPPASAQPDIAGAASANIDLTPVLADGTDTDLVAVGFQGATTAVHVIPDAKSAQTGSINRIAEAIGIVPAGTGVVTLNDGTFAVASTVTIGKSLILEGESQAGVLIDANAITGTWGVNPAANDITIRTLRIDGPGGGSGAYGIHASGPVPATHLTGLLIEDVTVYGSGRSGVDLHGVDGAQVTNLTVTDNGGNGIAFTDSKNSTVTSLTASGNDWGQMAIYTSGVWVAGGSDNITLDGTNSITPDTNGVRLYTQTNATNTITNVHVSADDFTHVVRSLNQPAYVWYQPDRATATLFGQGHDTVFGSRRAAVSPEADRNLFQVDGDLAIQAAIDLAVSGDDIHVHPGDYSETAAARGTTTDSGPYTYGLFLPPSKSGLTLQGVTLAGALITDADDVEARITTNATNGFGPSGIFVAGEGTTIRGLEIGENASGVNKTIEVLGDGFSFLDSYLNDTNEGSIYFGDFSYDTIEDESSIITFTIARNRFAEDNTLDITNGTGYGHPVADRVIEDNVFVGAPDWWAISFRGQGGPVWYEHPVGGATIEDNAFGPTDVFIRATGVYDEAQFDWDAFLDDNTYPRWVVTRTPGDAVRSFSYTSGSSTFTNARVIGGNIDTTDATRPGGVDIAHAGDTVVVGPGTYAEQVVIDESLTLLGSGATNTFLDGPAMTGTGISITASDVTIEDLTVRDYDLGIHMLTGPISDVTLRDVRSVDNDRHGLWSQAFDLSDLTIDGGQYSRNNQAGGKAGRGIWIINGDKTDITITDVQAVDNGLVGIDLSDGTVTGLTITGNTVTDNGDSGIGVLGATGPGANLVADNTVTDNGRFGIEIKNPDGSGATSGAGSIVVEDNDVSRAEAATDARDHVGIVVMRRDPVSGTNVDQPTGVVIRDNSVSGFVRKTSGATGDGFGIVVEGTGHLVTGNAVSDNDIGIQAQAGNPAINTQNTDWFDRGNATSYSGSIIRNSITGNDIGVRAVGLGSDASATCNWWGSSTGPSGEGPGSGDSVSEDVTFAPWLLTSALDGSCVAAAVDTAAADDTDTEGSTLTASGSFVGDALTLTYDDGPFDGTFTPDHEAGTWTYSVVTTDDVASSPVTVTATSDNGTSATDTFNLVATNVAPSGTFDAPASADEAVGFLVSVTDAADPSSVDLAALTYAFDCGDGAGYGTATTTASTTCTIPDGPDTVTVKVTIADDDSSVELTDSVSIVNVDPTGTLVITSTPTAEGGTFTLSVTGASDVAADLGSLEFAFDCGAGYGAPSTSPTSDPCTTATEGPATISVKAKVIDKDDGETELPGTVTVTNVAPTGTIVAPVAVSEGSTFQVAVTDATDISAVDAADLTFAFDCGDGSGYGPASSDDEADCTAIDGPGTQTVKAKVIDPDGDSTELTDTVGTVNLNPTAGFVAPGSVQVGEEFTLSLIGGDDASSVDAANLTYSFDCGTGYGSPGSSNEALCTAPGTAGPLVVKGRVHDPDGGITPYTDTVDIEAAPVGSAELDPASHTFAVTKVGATRQSTFTLENGATPLDVGTVSITGDDADQFDVDASDCAADVPVGGSCEIVVTFAPISVGLKEATLNVPHDAPGSPETAALSGEGAVPDASIDPTSKDFGEVVVGEQSAVTTFTVSNDGPVGLVLGTPALAGTNPGQFTMTQGCPATLPAGESCEIDVRFAPTNATPSAKSATLEVTTDDPDALLLSASLSGEALTRLLTIDPTSQDFGDARVDDTTDPVTFTVTNDGTAPVSITDVGTGGSNPGHFDIDVDNCDGETLDPAETCTIDVVFAPNSAGTKTAKLVTTSDAAGSPTEANLTGKGVQPIPQLVPAAWDFGDVVVGGSSAVKTFTLSNEGTGPFEVQSVSLGGNNPGQFSIEDQECELEVLGPTDECTIEVVFEPTSAGEKSARLNVTTDVAGSQPRSDLSGTGVVPPTGGTIRIVVESLPAANQDFAFSGALGSFSLDDDSNGTLANTREVAGLAPGAHAITQNDPAGWTVVAIACTPDQAEDKPSRTATVTIIDDEVVTCTFTNVRRQPDAMVSRTGQSGPFKGADLYASTPIANQTIKRTGGGPGTHRYWVRVQNDSLRGDRFRLAATDTGAGGMTVRYLVGGTDVSAAIRAGTYLTTSRPPNGSMVVEVRVTVAASVTPGKKRTVVLTATSDADGAAVDVVRMITQR